MAPHVKEANGGQVHCEEEGLKVNEIQLWYIHFRSCRSLFLPLDRRRIRPTVGAIAPGAAVSYVRSSGRSAYAA
jgi:hypothetical protein